MIIILPLVMGELNIEAGFRRTINAGGSTLAVKADDAFHIYVASGANRRAATSEVPVAIDAEDLPGDPRIVLTDATMLDVGADWVRLDVSAEMAVALNIASPLNICDGSDAHSFYDSDLNDLEEAKDEHGPYYRCDKCPGKIR